MEDPAAAWKQLEQTFGSNTASNVARLRREFQTIKFNSSITTMADHLERMQQLAQEIGQLERPLLPSELATAMLTSLPEDYGTIVQGINAVDKETDPVYVYTKLISEEQRRDSNKPKSGSNDKSENALNASHHQDNKPGNRSNNTRKCYNCNKPGHFARECRSRKRNNNSRNRNNNNSRNSNSSNHDNNNDDNKGGRKYPPCTTCKKTNHPSDQCHFKKIYDQAKAAAVAEARAALVKPTNSQVWGTSPDLS